MAVGVVDVFEPVEVDDQQRDRAFAGGTGEGLVQTLADRGAVGEPGQRIATRLFRHARLEQRRA